MNLSTEFREILDNPTSTETDAMRFIKRYPYLMIQMFNVSWNYYAVFPEFPLGTDYRADFLIVSADSCGWHAVFVELEGPNDQIYIKDGSAAQKLRQAQKQVEDWKKYVRTNSNVVKSEISKRLKPKEVPAQNKLMSAGGKAHDEILLPDVLLNDTYRIMIGRRASFAGTPEHHMPTPGFGIPSLVCTFDRVLEYLVGLEGNQFVKNVPEFLQCSDTYAVHGC